MDTSHRLNGEILPGRIFPSNTLKKRCKNGPKTDEKRRLNPKTVSAHF